MFVREFPATGQIYIFYNFSDLFGFKCKISP
jgi:hypothetical protein